VEAAIFIGVMLLAIFAFDLGKRWWRENEWQRRWRERDEE